MARNRKKKSLYKKSLIVFVLVLVILIEGFLLYVNKSLQEYEMGDVDGYLTHLIKDMQKQAKKGQIDKYFDLADFKSKYETNSDMQKGYKQLLTEMEVSYKKAKDDDKYQIYAGDVLIATVTLENLGAKHRLGLLSYEEYKVKSIESYNKDGLYEMDFYLSNGFELYLNGIKVSEDYIIDSKAISGYEDVKEYSNVPKVNHYRVTDLTYKPSVEVRDSNGKKAKVKYESYDYYAKDYFHTDNHEEAMAKLAHECDPLAFPKNWSLFLSADLPGTRWGLYTLTPSLIEGTEIYKVAYDWATGVDVTFTSVHTLDKDTFTNVKASNYVVYNENAFSVDVYFEKNMTLINGEKRQDVFNETLYYMYHDGAYRVVSM